MRFVRQRTALIIVLAAIWLAVGVPLLCVQHCRATAAPRQPHAGHTFLCDPALAGVPLEPAAPNLLTPQLLQALMLLTVLASAALLVPLAWAYGCHARPPLVCGIAGPPQLRPPR